LIVSKSKNVQPPHGNQDKKVTSKTTNISRQVKTLSVKLLIIGPTLAPGQLQQANEHFSPQNVVAPSYYD
jgi:hypothetical protein